MTDRNLILKAAEFARAAHEGQVRRYSGEPYVRHPARVASRIALLSGATEVHVVAGFLHDVLEDCKQVTASDLAQEFGGEITELVFQLTNTSKKHPGLSRNERKKMDREHVANASLWAKKIKLLDRIDNLPVGMAVSDPEFARKYVPESRLLLEVLKGTDKELEQELLRAIEALETALGK